MARVHLPMMANTGRAEIAVDRAAAELGASGADPLVDRFSRRIKYLRVSVTDRCNYRCSYCMPESLANELQFQPRSALLTFEELERIVGVFAGFGVRKVRLTGGEPTVRHGIVELVRRIAALDGIDQVVMTTNGHVLADLAAPLATAGLTGVNVSIDTLDPERFHRVTGRGDLSRVLAGVDAARAVGMRVKTNAVAIVGINDRELPALCRDAWARGALPRFIEHMPMSDGMLYAPAQGISAQAIRAAIEAELGALVPINVHGADAGPARYWAVERDAACVVGIISAMTDHFCDDCNRLRLTAAGDLHACLGYDDATSLRDVVRAGGSDRDIACAIAAAVTGKRAGHTFAVAPPTKHMVGIGG